MVGLNYGADNKETQHCARVPAIQLTYRCAIVETTGEDPNAHFFDAFTDYVFNEDCSAYTKVGTHLSNTAVAWSPTICTFCYAIAERGLKYMSCGFPVHLRLRW